MPTESPMKGGGGTRFDYSRRIDQVVEHISHTCPALSYVQPEKLLNGIIQSRAAGTHGVYAHITPLRFKGGASSLTSRGRTFTWPRVVYGGREILYLVQFMLPRFADLPYRDKITTIFHELYHVSPECNGDLRRFPGRNYAHGSSREEYNLRLQPWIEAYLRQPTALEITGFLQHDFKTLSGTHGSLVGRSLPRVRPISTPR